MPVWFALCCFWLGWSAVHVSYVFRFNHNAPSGGGGAPCESAAKSTISLVTEPCPDALCPNNWHSSQKAGISPVVLVARLCFKGEMNILF